jgi:xylobiose transport system permease protein
MYLEGFQSFDMGYASVLACLVLALGTAVSVGIARGTGYTRMTSEREGL